MTRSQLRRAREGMKLASVAPSMSRSSMLPSAPENSGLRNLASKKLLSSARMNLRAGRL